MAGIPAWARNFAESVADGFTGTGGGPLDYRYCSPDEQNHGGHLFLFGPQPVEISGGEYDGEEVFEFLSVDIQIVQQAFTQLEDTSYHAARGDEWYRRRHIALSGLVGKRQVVIYIYDEPLDNAETKTIIDTTSKKVGST